MNNSKQSFVGELCQPLDPGIEYGAVFETQFPPQGVTLSLRPLYLAVDDPLIREFARLELPERKELAEVLYRTKKQELGMLTISNLGQSFLGLIDGHPAFLLTIHRMQQHTLGQYYAALPGDYKFQLERLPVVGHRDADLYATAVWQTSTACVFAFPEVRRLITALDMLRPSEKQYCRAAGFRHMAGTGRKSEWEELYVNVR